MRGRYGLEDVRRHRAEIDDAKQDDGARRLLAACRGELRARIRDVVHGHDGKAGLPRTACGVRWVPGNSGVFPQGVPTEDEVDCMSCLVRMAAP
jgi:hypothetical protein